MIVCAYLKSVSGELFAEFTEVESGRKNDRAQLQEALRICRVYSAVLIIAKMDRLARNVALTSGLMESGVEFVAADFPEANRLTIHILAAIRGIRSEADLRTDQGHDRCRAIAWRQMGRRQARGQPSFRRGADQGEYEPTSPRHIARLGFAPTRARASGRRKDFAGDSERADETWRQDAAGPRRLVSQRGAPDFHLGFAGGVGSAKVARSYAAI